ncbi:TolC family outer membrane protein [Tritonibacter horizontis]|uniref:Outer membrane efflux protein BepC n=1 Tax=Tritonibacter horizontis TaxID=1768241 RepID=A0A132BY09_9RHOB|nr:TolC family outer membrane protein [Tritonibacter horizontis]KUP93265.1 outer membrane efflux protein BepC precursor [Tritonibacter horizontis]
MRVIFKLNRIRALAAFGVLASTLAHAPLAQADNVTDAMIGAYTSSGLLEQNRALLRVADEGVALSMSSLRPVINTALSIARSYDRTGLGRLGANSSHSTSASLRLSLEWLLFDNGASKLSTMAAQEAVLATRQTLLDVEQQVLFSAVDAYVSVLTQQDNVALRQNNLRLLQEEMRAANDRFEVGEVTRTDVALAESRVAEARANLTDAQGALLTARATYEEVVGRAPGAITAYPPLPRRASSLDAAQARALNSHPSLRAQQHAVRSAQLTADSSLRDMGPSISFSASTTHREIHSSETETDSFDLGLELSQTLYAGGALAASRRRDLANVDAERGRLLSTQRSITSNAASAYTAFDTAAASLVSSNERVRAAQVAFDGIREEATLGARTTLDVLQAEQELLDAQTARLNARALQALAAYDLLQAQGLLTVDNLNLAVERYDPEIYYNQVRAAPAFVTKRGQDLDRVLKALRKN